MQNMQWVDVAIVVIMAAAVISGAAEGFFRSAFSLGGLVLGLAVAAWNYTRFAPLFMPLVRSKAIADTIAFLLVALLVMAVAALIGAILAKAFRLLGLGCLDGFAGAIFGFFQGVIMVTLGILVIVAFFPEAHWLEDAKLPKMFFGFCHLSTHVSPEELAHRVREGLKALQHETPQLLHPRESGS
jgi:membrane protein required for colicin V production